MEYPRYKKPQVKVFLFILAVFVSWIWSPMRFFWDQIDLTLAKLFNAMLIHSTLWQNFVIFSNSRTADWLYDFVMIALLAFAYKKARTIDLSTLILAVTLVSCIHIGHYKFVSRRFIHETLEYKRNSPSLTLENYVSIHELRPDVKTKDRSNHSFPADHGFTCALFISTIFILFGRRFALLALVFSLTHMMARVFIGAHWMTDILIGSTLLALFYNSILFYTPVFGMIRRSHRDKGSQKSVSRS